MKTIRAIFVVVLFSVALANARPPKETESTSWAGNFQDKNFLKGRAVFQLNIMQEGGQISVDFDVVYNNGQGCAPEANAMAKTVDKNTLQFNFTDSSHNSGTGTITRAGDDVIISIKTTRVADSRCLVFYGQNMRLKRAGKK